MPELYPLLLLPEFHERVWGALDLRPIYARETEGKPIGEVWLTGDACRVANGPLRGRTLAELAREHGAALVGEAAADAHRFPLLIKFLFPRQKLSVQVHPDDAGARAIGESCGKTECWYVLAAEKGAQVALGLKPGTTRADLKRAIEQTRAEELLNWIDIRSGELIYVEAGTVHAIGPGSILVETQQNSDTTYRLYDYGRPRALHVEQGLAATKEKTGAGKVPPAGNNGHATLVASPCFVVERVRLKKGEEFAAEARKSAQVLVALNGCGIVGRRGSEDVSFARGEVVVVPAETGVVTVRPQWELECLRMTLPARSTTPPAVL
jgi:mannose-6-phosphate isomerase